MDERKIIIAIVGDSGCGKTTLGRMLCDRLGYNWIPSYTTRPMREGETDRVEHIFVDESVMPERDRMVAYALFGGYHYWTTFDQFMRGANVYIIDEDALVEMEKLLMSKNDWLHPEYDIIKVYMKRDGIDVDEDRKERDNQRTKLPECCYDVVLENNGTLEELYESAKVKIGAVVDFARSMSTIKTQYS